MYTCCLVLCKIKHYCYSGNECVHMLLHCILYPAADNRLVHGWRNKLVHDQNEAGCKHLGTCNYT